MIPSAPKRGIAYVIVLIAIMLLLVFGASLHFITGQKGKQISHSINETICYKLTESALDQALFLIRKDSNDYNKAYPTDGGKPDIGSAFAQFRLPSQVDGTDTNDPGGGLGIDKSLQLSPLQQDFVYDESDLKDILDPLCEEIGCELVEAEVIGTVGKSFGISSSGGKPTTVGIDLNPGYRDQQVENYFTTGDYPSFTLSFPRIDVKAGIKVGGIQLPIYKLLKKMGLNKLLELVDMDNIVNKIAGKEVLPYEFRRDGAQLKDISEVVPDGVTVPGGFDVDENALIEKYGTLDLSARVKFRWPNGEEVERVIKAGKEFKVADVQPIAPMYSLFIRNTKDEKIRFNYAGGGRFFVNNSHDWIFKFKPDSSEVPGLIRVNGTEENPVRLGPGNFDGGLTGFVKSSQWTCIVCTPRLSVSDVFPIGILEKVSPGFVADSGCGHWWFPASLIKWHKSLIINPLDLLAYVVVDFISEVVKMAFTGNWPTTLNDWLGLISNIDFPGMRNVIPTFGTWPNYGWLPVPDQMGPEAKTYLFGQMFLYPTMSRKIEGRITKEVLELRVGICMFTIPVIGFPIPLWKTKIIDDDYDFTFCSGLLRPKEMQAPAKWESKTAHNWDGKLANNAPENLYSKEQYIKKASLYYQSEDDFLADFNDGRFSDADGNFVIEGIIYIHAEDGQFITIPPGGDTLKVRGRGAIVTPGDIRITGSVKHIDDPFPTVFSLISLDGGIAVDGAEGAIVEACLFAKERFKTNCKFTLLGNLAVDAFDKKEIGDDFFLRYKSSNCRTSLESIKFGSGKYDPRRYHVSIGKHYNYFKYGGIPNATP